MWTEYAEDEWLEVEKQQKRDASARLVRVYTVKRRVCDETPDHREWERIAPW